MSNCIFHFFFFFQAEDGIRDLTVTGVQTCALPISAPRALAAAAPSERDCSRTIAEHPPTRVAGPARFAAQSALPAKCSATRTTSSNRISVDRARKSPAPLLDPAA